MPRDRLPVLAGCYLAILSVGENSTAIMAALSDRIVHVEQRHLLPQGGKDEHTRVRDPCRIVPPAAINAACAHPFFAREEQEGLSPWHECS